MFNSYSGSAFFHQINNIVAFVGGLMIYFFLAASSNVINDIFDMDIDSINRPTRPIPSGKIQRKQAIYYAAILMFLAIGTSIGVGLFTPNPWLVPLTIIVFGGISYLYSWKGKASGFPGNILVGISFSSGIPFGGILVSSISEIPLYLWFFFATAVFLLISRELVKGMEDIEGDSKFDQKTVAIVHGFRFTAWISGFFSICSIATFTIPVFLYSFNVWFLVIMLSGNVFVLVSIILLIRPDRKKNQTRASLCLKIGAYLGLLAYISAIF